VICFIFFLHPWFQVDADGPHVADDLVPRFIKSEIETALPTPAGGIAKWQPCSIAGAGSDTLTFQKTAQPSQFRPKNTSLAPIVSIAYSIRE